MSNVVKLKAGKKKLEIDDWKAAIEALSHGLSDRLYDQIKLTADEADDEGMPEEIADCMIAGVFVSVLVYITHARNILGPEALLNLVKCEIEQEDEEP